MPIEVDVRIDGGDWHRALPGAEAECRQAARAAAAAVMPGIPSAELSIVLTDDAAIAALNRDFRGKAGPTNVLSFPALAPNGLARNEPGDGMPCLLGDVVVAHETATAEAEAAGKALGDHLRHLVVHGVLHILGYDHLDDAAAERMEALETAILDSMGIEDPYRDEKHFVA